MSDFLPEGYKTPQSNSGYTKFEEGETRIRILSKPIMYWEVWENKNVSRYPFEITGEKPDKNARHCWALKAYNYKDECMQVCQIHQIGIKTAIENLARDTDWGNPFDYDIKIIRKGKDLNDTKYSVNPAPKSPVSDKVKEAFKKTPINLEALIHGESPFETSENGKAEPPKVQKKVETVADVIDENSDPF